MMKIASIWLMLVLFLSTTLLTGCGQKGDLYHPTDEDQMRRDNRDQ